MKNVKSGFNVGSFGELSTKDAYMSARLRKPLLPKLGEYAIAQFLKQNADQFVVWLDDHVPDVEVQNACMARVHEADQALEQAKGLVRFADEINTQTIDSVCSTAFATHAHRIHEAIHALLLARMDAFSSHQKVLDRQLSPTSNDQCE